jgi:nucleoside-diphosphate-sugar epimerase
MGPVLVTGASGQIGSRLTSLLRASGHQVVAVDIRPSTSETIELSDITRDDQVARLFGSGSIRTVVHLAAVLPTAFRADPIAGGEVNVTGTLRLLREAVRHGVGRFVLGSSMSVYGSSHPSRALDERDLTAPDEPYGAAKRAVELVGESLAAATGLDFVALRIARVVGPGATSTASSWRSQIFEASPSPGRLPITIPFDPTARLSLTYVDEVARMLVLLAEAADIPRRIYNSPVEVWETRHLAELVEQARNVPVRLGEAQGGPICDGTAFTEDFEFRLRGLADYLSSRRGSTGA